MIPLPATYTDLYQLSMAQVYFLKGAHQKTAVFDYFFRKLPFGGGYAVFCGLEHLLEQLENLRFSSEDLNYLKSQGFHPDFLTYLREFRFRGKIRSAAEGDLIFPGRPILQVEGTITEGQIIETLLLNMLNFSSLVATKARRIWNEANGKTLLELGLRRAQALGGYQASYASIIGGFQGSSNVMAGRDLGIPVSGSMAHAYIQSYDSEYEAFSDFATTHPDQCILLVDTYNTLESGVPTAIKVAKEMERKGHRLRAVRLDSGDLAYLSRKTRTLLDEAGLSYVKIVASNQLDEFIIRSLESQKAPIDIYGVGTNLVAAKPDAALDGVYKLAWFDGKPRIKISETMIKVTLPHRKQVFRMRNKDGSLFGADGIALAEETGMTQMYHPTEPVKSLKLSHLDQEPLLHNVMEKGKRLTTPKSFREIQDYSMKRFAELPSEYKRLEYPHLYKIGISDALMQSRNSLLNKALPHLKNISDLKTEAW